MSISLGSVTVVLVVTRIIFKRFFHATRALAPDDKVVLGTLAMRISGIIVNVRGFAHHGLGKDVWTLSPAQLTTFGMFFYVMEIMYLVELSLVKISLSLFFLFIFPNAIIRRLLIGTTIFNVLSGVAFAATGIFQCTPVRYFWAQYSEPSADGHCININVFGWTNAVISIAVDIWLIAIPLSQVPALNLHWKKKLGVVIMFLMGAL
jgi:hypothetical protein